LSKRFQSDDEGEDVFEGGFTEDGGDDGEEEEVDELAGDDGELAVAGKEGDVDSKVGNRRRD
jgi:hypothetical protein